MKKKLLKSGIIIFCIIACCSVLYITYIKSPWVKKRKAREAYLAQNWGLDQKYDILVQRNILGSDNTFYPRIIDDAIYRYDGYFREYPSSLNVHDIMNGVINFPYYSGCLYRMYSMNDRVNHLDQEVRQYMQQHHIDHAAIPVKGYNIKPVSDLKNPISYLRLFSMSYDGQPDPNQNLDTTKQFFIQPNYKRSFLGLRGGVKVGIKTPWIKLSDLTPEKVFKHAEPINNYPYYQYCLQFLQDNKPGLQKDLFKDNVRKTFIKKGKFIYFEEEYRKADYAKQYSKSDFVDVITAKDTLVKYSQDYDGSDIYFFNQRKKILIYLHINLRETKYYRNIYKNEDFDKQDKEKTDE